MNRAICANKKIGTINIKREMHCPKRIYKRIYTDIIEIDNDKISNIEQYRIFFNKAGNAKYEVEFVDLPSEKVKEKLPEKYFIVYPSASTEYKRWPTERFAKIAEKIYAKLKIPLVVCGTEGDKKTNEALKELVKNVPIIDMTNKTSVLEYIDLIKNATLVICNDTGIYHIATISQTPVAILGGGYTYHKYMEYKFEGCEKFKRPCIITEYMDCFNCENRCKYSKNIAKTWPCLDRVTVEKAWSIIEKMIEEEKL